MGFFGKLLGIEDDSQRQRSPREGAAHAGFTPGAGNADAQALERYHYMLKTAPPETIEQAHAEAFGKLTPEQRRQLLGELAASAPPGERSSIAATSVDDPRALAQVATRAELRQPGVVERSLGGAGMGMGASLLSSFAMGFVGSMVAQSFFSAMGGFGDAGAGAEETASNDDPAADDADAADDGGGDDFGGGGDFEI